MASEKLKVLVIPSDRFGVGLYRSVSPHVHLDREFHDDFDVEINYSPNYADFA